MRYARILLVATSLLAATDLRPLSARAESSADQAAIVSAEQTWADALLGNDVSRVEQLLDPRFRLIMAGNIAWADHEAYLQLCDERDYVSMEPTVLSVEVTGDVAVAVVEMNVGWPDSFLPAPSDWEFIDTWVKSGGTWRAVSRVAQAAEKSDS